MKLRHSLMLVMLLAGRVAAQVPATRPMPTPAPSSMPPMPVVAPFPAFEPFELYNSMSVALSDLVDLPVTPHFDMSEINARVNDAMWNRSLAELDMLAPGAAGAQFFDGLGAPPSWASQDPADSLYRVAREHLNRGDYRRAATLFGEIDRRHPASTYGAAAMYYQAFSLYRIGGTAELQDALTVLEAHHAKYPDEASGTPARAPRAGAPKARALLTMTGKHRTRADVDALAARIASVLATRGLAAKPAVKRALESSGQACDAEDQSVRASALSALSQTDPDGARTLATRILARRDECSVPLRRGAIFLIGARQDDAATAMLINVAKTDPAAEIRLEAINWLARVPGDGAVTALEELARSADDERVQRAAVRALAMHPSQRARAATRTLIERNDGMESLRLAAFDGLGGDRASVEDATWLRGVYPRITSQRVKERIVATVARIGGDANQQWLVALSRDENEPVSSRTAALRRVATTMDIQALGRLYDASAERAVREALLSVLASRSEPGALDKLIDVARTGTDPAIRRMAIAALARSKDPRASKLLMELIDR